MEAFSLDAEVVEQQSSASNAEVDVLTDDRRKSSQAIHILVDDRERLRDKDPRGLLERIASIVEPHAHVVCRRLRFGDYMWVAGTEDSRVEDCLVCGCVVERKRISDLVGRSASGVHMQQLQKLESCGLAYPFLLIEGEPRAASTCTVYDKPISSDDGDAGGGPSGHIASEEDIEDLCARLLVAGPHVGVIMTKDAQCTSRVLGQLTAWLEWTLPRRSLSSGAGQNMHTFERAGQTLGSHREDLSAMLMVAGIPAAARECICQRFKSVDAVKRALLSCASPSHRVHLFDSHPACVGIGERICAALGIASPTLEQPQPAWARAVRISASPLLFKRLGMTEASPQVLLEEAPGLWVNGIGGCCAEVIVHAEAPGHAVQCSSDVIVLVVAPGSALLQDVLLAARSLGVGAPSAAIADAAASNFAARLPSSQQHRAPRGPRLVVLEGIRSAILAEARRADRRIADNGLDGAAHAAADIQKLLPRLLGLVELAALALDLRGGWRVRVHDTRPAAMTAGFVRAVVRAALEEAMLPHASN